MEFGTSPDSEGFTSQFYECEQDEGFRHCAPKPFSVKVNFSEMGLCITVPVGFVTSMIIVMLPRYE